MNYSKMFTVTALQEFIKVFNSGEFFTGLWATIYSTLLSTFFALIIGIPLGVLLVVGEKDGVLPLPKWLMSILNTFINILRSVPFLILMHFMSWD